MALSHHMTYDRSHFEGLKNLKRLIVITLPNGFNVKVLQHGSVNLTSSITLSRVLYIPSFKCNVISIPKLIKDLNCYVIYSSDLCFIQD